jgi:hypothetical protein
MEGVVWSGVICAQSTAEKAQRGSQRNFMGIPGAELPC